MKSEYERELDEIFGDFVEESAVANAGLAIDVATQLCALRRLRGYSQRDAAVLSGRSQQAISKLENPSHSGHNLSTLREVVAAMQAVLDVTIVPLEQLDLYRSLFPPKPVLEDLELRVDEPSHVSEPGEEEPAGSAQPAASEGLRLSDWKPTGVPTNVIQFNPRAANRGDRTQLSSDALSVGAR